MTLATAFFREYLGTRRLICLSTLIGTEEFADQWAYYYGELFRTRAASFHYWTKTWLKVDRPYNDVFADMMTPTTKNGRGLPTAMTIFDPVGQTAARDGAFTDRDNYRGLNRLDWIDGITTEIGRVFLGVSIECFSCHNGAGHTDSPPPKKAAADLGRSRPEST
jgi:hypothetical protein